MADYKFSEELRLVRSRKTGLVMPYAPASQNGAADLLNDTHDMEPYFGPIPTSGKTEHSAATPEEGKRLFDIVEEQRAAREKAAATPLKNDKADKKETLTLNKTVG